MHPAPEGGAATQEEPDPKRGSSIGTLLFCTRISFLGRVRHLSGPPGFDSIRSHHVSGRLTAETRGTNAETELSGSPQSIGRPLLLQLLNLLGNELDELLELLELCRQGLNQLLKLLKLQLLQVLHLLKLLRHELQQLKHLWLRHSRAVGANRDRRLREKTR